MGLIMRLESEGKVSSVVVQTRCMEFHPSSMDIDGNDCFSGSLKIATFLSHSRPQPPLSTSSLISSKEKAKVQNRHNSIRSSISLLKPTPNPTPHTLSSPPPSSCATPKASTPPTTRHTGFLSTVGHPPILTIQKTLASAQL